MDRRSSILRERGRDRFATATNGRIAVEFFSTVARGDWRGLSMKVAEWRDLVEGLRDQWKKMWRRRIDDKVRAEGIAHQEFPKLFVEQGTVIVATRDYRPPDFGEILERHRLDNLVSQEFPLSPSHGGYRRFVREVISKQKRYSLEESRRGMREQVERKEKPQLKKRGKGWLHYEHGFLRRRS